MSTLRHYAPSYSIIRPRRTLRDTEEGLHINTGPLDFEYRTSSEWNRRDRLSQVSCTCVTVFLILFSINDLRIGEVKQSLVLLTFASVNFLALMLYQHFRNQDIFGYYLLVSYSAICVHLVSSGGTGDSGLLWLPCYPIVIYSFLLYRVATAANIGLALVVCFILFFAQAPIYTATYGEYFKVIALASYALSSVFSFSQAHSRNTSMKVNDQLTKELQYIASTDELTGLANRRDMSTRLEFESKRSKRTGSDFSIILADIDYFKRINDNFGHDIGDIVLKEFSRVFAARFRDTDKVGRWGGEEFLVILPNTEMQEAIRIADEVRKTISQTGLLPNMPHRLITMSAGVACISEAESIVGLLKVADNRLYAAKDAGRNRIQPEGTTVSDA